MKYCSQCGQQLSDGDRFCGACGAASPEPEETASAAKEREMLPAAPAAGESRGRKKVVIIGTVFVLLLVAGVLWGWMSHGLEARVQAKLDLAVKCLSENKFDEAVLTYREVIKIDSKNVPAYKGLSVAYSLQGKNTEAEQALQEGIEKVSDKKPLKLAMAGLMVDTGKADQAAAIYNEVISGDAGYVPAYRAYTKFLVSSGRQAEAVALLEKAAGGGSDYRLYSLLAEAHLSAGNQEGAKDAAVKSLSMEFNQSEAYRTLEKVYDGRLDDLISLGDQYIQQGQSPLGFAMKLSGLVAGGRNQEAISLYQQLPEEVKSLARVKLLTAGSYIKSGQKDQGLAILKEIITSDLKDAALVADIAALYLEAGDKGKVREVAIAGMALDDAVVDNYIVLSNSYGEEGESQKNIWRTKYMLNCNLSINQVKKEQEIFIRNMTIKNIKEELITEDANTIQNAENDHVIDNTVFEKYVGKSFGNIIYHPKDWLRITDFEEGEDDYQICFGDKSKDITLNVYEGAFDKRGIEYWMERDKNQMAKDGSKVISFARIYFRGLDAYRGESVNDNWGNRYLTVSYMKDGYMGGISITCPIKLWDENIPLFEKMISLYTPGKDFK